MSEDTVEKKSLGGTHMYNTGGEYLEAAIVKDYGCDVEGNHHVDIILLESHKRIASVRLGDGENEAQSV